MMTASCATRRRAVMINGQTYRGNVFSGANSTTGGTADLRNNVESVFLPAGTSGNFTVTVRAANIAGDGVPGNADTTDNTEAASIYHNLGGLAHARGRYSEGESLARQAVEIRLRALGPDHVDVAADVAALAAIPDGQRKVDD